VLATVLWKYVVCSKGACMLSFVVEVGAPRVQPNDLDAPPRCPDQCHSLVLVRGNDVVNTSVLYLASCARWVAGTGRRVMVGGGMLECVVSLLTPGCGMCGTSNAAQWGVGVSFLHYACGRLLATCNLLACVRWCSLCLFMEGVLPFTYD
jgi:hypothetical protein